MFFGYVGFYFNYEVENNISSDKSLLNSLYTEKNNINTYADLNEDFEKILHGVARLHVSLGRMDNEKISTRGWSYNNLVDYIILLSEGIDEDNVKQIRCIEILFDTLIAICEIGPNAVEYLNTLHKLDKTAA